MTISGAVAKVYNEEEESFDVSIQSSTQPLFQYFLMEEQKTDITLTAPINVEDTDINVSSGHGFINGVAGQYIVVRNGDQFFQGKVVGVVGDIISVSIPVSTSYPTTSSVIRGNNLLNKDGSTSEILYKFTSDKTGGVDAEIPIDIQTVILTMTHSTEADDSKFGNISILPQDSFYFRKINGSTVNLIDCDTNQSFRDYGGIVTYSDKAGGGEFATIVQFNLKDVLGQEVRLNPRVPDSVVAVVRANFGSLTKFTLSIMGSLTSGE